jgi:hypothetical protein
MEKFIIIFQDLSADFESDPNLLHAENNTPFIGNSVTECEDFIKADINYWKMHRPYPEDVEITNEGTKFKISDSYGSCEYFIKKIIL